MERTGKVKIRSTISVDPEVDEMARAFGEKLGLSKSEVYENAVRAFVRKRNASELADQMAALRKRILSENG